MSLYSYAHNPLRPRATEEQLEAIHTAAGLGLVGDNIAHNVGIMPKDYFILREADPKVQLAEEKGRADAEAFISAQLHSWAASGDKAAIKACIAILQNKHAWVTTTKTEVTIDERISVSVALERARQRVIEAEYDDVPAIEDRTPLQRANDRLASIEDAEHEDGE